MSARGTTASNSTIETPSASIAAARSAIAREAGLPPEAIERCETHLSVVLLAGDRAYKLYRARALPFVDHRSLAARRGSCRAELERNRTLAGDVYLRVRSIVPDDGGHRLADEADPAAIDYVVEMLRFDAADSLAERARRDDVPDDVVARIARTLVRYHGEARRLPSEPTPAAAAALASSLVDVNLDELLATLPDRRDRARVERIRRRLLAYALDHNELLAARRADGWIRDLHGDLRAEHVVVDRQHVRVIDAIEFSQALHEVDVADELAFLTVDLEAQGAEEVATRLLAAYRADGGDLGPATLRAFYAAHRACVRAKVATLRSTAPDDRHALEARRLLAVAERCAWRSRATRAYVLCGPSGSGKSYLAGRLGERTGLTVISSDVVRKRAAGLAATDRGSPDLYTPTRSVAIYEQLGRQAAEELDGGSSVVVDATCLRRDDRRALARGLGEHDADALYVACVAPAAVLRERVEVRLGREQRTSDADLSVLERQLADAEPLDEIPAANHLLLRTDAPADDVLARLTAVLDP